MTKFNKPTVTVYVIGRGANLNASREPDGTVRTDNSKGSRVGHMFYGLDDGKGKMVALYCKYEKVTSNLLWRGKTQ